MAGFYKAFTTRIGGKPVIVYPCMGLEKVLSRAQHDSIEKHLEKLYSTNSFLNVGTYHSIILWDESSDDTSANAIDVMTDVWIFDKLDSWGSGPLADVKIFRNTELESGIGVSSGDGLLVLGREEELRRTSESLEKYLNGNRPELPADISSKENFYKK